MLPASAQPRVCSVCKVREFWPRNSLHRVCSPRCATKLAKAAETARKLAHKVEKAQDRAKRQSLETLPKLKQAAQREFNKWVRARDHDKPCISCGAPPPDLSGFHAGRDAGHYRSVGAAAHLRFHEDNCHAQCVYCNQWKAGKAVDYRIGLVARIGIAAVESLESNAEVKRWTHDELRQIAALYRAKLKELRRD